MAGYEVGKWVVNGAAVPNNTTNEYSHKVTATTEVKVVFKLSAVAVTGVTLNENKLTLEEGKSKQLTAMVNPTNATNTKVMWHSDNEAVASVDQNGMVTANKVGTAKITVTTADGNKTADCAVTVSPPKYQVTFSVDGDGGNLTAQLDGNNFSSGQAEHGKTVTFTATPADADYRIEKWTITGGTFETGGTEGSPTATVKITTETTVKVSFTRYKSVAFGTNGADLAAYLSTGTPAADGIYYIEVTGLSAADLKGDSSNYPYQSSPLGVILKANPTKKIALKLGGSITGLQDMEVCFSDCTNLVQIAAIPQGVQNMRGCFFECASLTKAPEIPQGVQNMSFCFSSCYELVQAPVIPEGVTDMERCFQDCKKLTKAPPAIPKGVTNMEGCFYGCESLVQAPVIPESVTDMEHCFHGCKSLTEAPEIRASALQSMVRCFAECESLTKAPVIPASVTNMGDCFSNCSRLKEAPAIPDKVTNISFCFQACRALTKAPKIPDDVTNMSYCFQDCGSLMEAPAIPEYVTNMECCFRRCLKLTQGPVIPASVEKMTSCFSDCSALKSVVLKCNYKNDFTFSSVFERCGSLEEGGIKVPTQASYNSYTANDALDRMKVPGDTPAEKKAKFAVYTP